MIVHFLRVFSKYGFENLFGPILAHFDFQPSSMASSVQVMLLAALGPSRGQPLASLHSRILSVSRCSVPYEAPHGKITLNAENGKTFAVSDMS